MSLPYENATSGGAALSEIQKVLTKFGCARFGTMTDVEKGELVVQFTYRGRDVTATASYRGYAAAWMKEHPYNGSRMRRTRVEHERLALKQAEISVCSVLRDWIKGQVVATDGGKWPKAVETTRFGHYALMSTHNAWQVWQARARIEVERYDELERQIASLYDAQDEQGRR